MSEFPEEALTTLSLEQMERLKPFGQIGEAPAGTVLVEEGDREPDLIVVVDGHSLPQCGVCLKAHHLRRHGLLGYVPLRRFAIVFLGF